MAIEIQKWLISHQCTRKALCKNRYIFPNQARNIGYIFCSHSPIQIHTFYRYKQTNYYIVFSTKLFVHLTQDVL